LFDSSFGIIKIMYTYSHTFHRERRVQLREDEYTDFQEEIARRRWMPLVTPMAKFDPEIVLEFYANAWPTERECETCARG